MALPRWTGNCLQGLVYTCQQLCIATVLLRYLQEPRSQARGRENNLLETEARAGGNSLGDLG